MSWDNSILEKVVGFKSPIATSWPRGCWYRGTCSRDLPDERPDAFNLYDQALVLLRNFSIEVI